MIEDERCAWLDREARDHDVHLEQRVAGDDHMGVGQRHLAVPCVRIGRAVHPRRGWLMAGGEQAGEPAQGEDPTTGTCDPEEVLS